MAEKAAETQTGEFRGAFYADVLKLLAATCAKYGEKGPELGRDAEGHTGDHADEEGAELDRLSHILSSLLYEFSAKLQNEASHFSTFDVVQRACDSIRKRLEAINYCKWNRIASRKYKNVYHKTLKRSLDPTYRRTSDDALSDFRLMLPKFGRSINVWAHHVLDENYDADKPYNEPPRVQVIRFDATGDVIITGGSEGIIKLWDVHTCKLIVSLKRHSGAIVSLDVHPTNAFLVSCCEGGEMWLWEISNNFYRPHRLVKSRYKFLWVRFLVNRHGLDGGTAETAARADAADRRNWERALEATLVVSVDANANLRVHKMAEMLSSSAGDNVYADVSPLYFIDLFNHNITAYDLSKCAFNGTFLTAIGIEPIDAQDLDNADLDDISTALNFIKNDSFHKPNINIKGRYKDLMSKSGFALLMVPLCDPAKAEANEAAGDSVCRCDVDLRSTATCLNVCTLCGTQKFSERRRLSLALSHYEGGDSMETATGARSIFLWETPNASEIEKFFVKTIPEFSFTNNTIFESYSPSVPTMHHGKHASALILPACSGAGERFEKEAGDFDRLFLNFVKDAHILSPDVCFANTSANHISASDDGKVFLWTHEHEGFKSTQLTTKTMEKWKSASTRVDPKHSTPGKGGPGPERDGGAASGASMMYVVVGLSWSAHDTYVGVADSMVSRYNYRKAMAQARTNCSGVSFFRADGSRVSDFLHEALNAHVSCLAFNPACEEVCLATSYDGLVALMDVARGCVLRRMAFGPTSVWMDVQWHPQGHKFVACQKYGCFSLFDADSREILERTPNFQCTYSDYYCSPLGYSNSAYAGPEAAAAEVRKYYSNFSNVPLTMNGASTYEKVTKALHGGPVIFVDEHKSNVVVHTSGVMARTDQVAFGRPGGAGADAPAPDFDLVYAAMAKLNGFREYFEAHYTHDAGGDHERIVAQFIEILGAANARAGADGAGQAQHPATAPCARDEFTCYLGDCQVCEGYLTAGEQADRYASVADASAQLNCACDKNGMILRSVPPAARPQEMAEGVTPERGGTPPQRTELHSLLSTLMSRADRETRLSTPEGRPALDSLFPDALVLDNNILFQSNTESDSRNLYEGDMADSTPTELIEPAQENEEDEQDDDYEQGPEEDEEEEEFDDEELDEDDELVAESTRRSTRMSRRQSSPDTPRRKSQRIAGEARGADYGLRGNRAVGSAARQRELAWAHGLELLMGPVAVLNQAGRDEQAATCVLCGMGGAGQYGRLTRTQSQRLSATLFGRGGSFNPVCRLFENALVGPINFPRRHHYEIDEYFEASKRAEAAAHVHAHAACLLAARVGTEGGRLTNFLVSASNPQEVLVNAKFETCAFCEAKFATVRCAKCDACFHYPCAIAHYREAAARAPAAFVNHVDPLVADEFVCADCAPHHEREREFVSGSCFLSPETRAWLTGGEDSHENAFNVQAGDLLVLTGEAALGRRNAHVPWLAQRPFPLLVRVLDIAYVFAGRPRQLAEHARVCACLLVAPADDADSRFCVLATPDTQLVLLRDFLLSAKALLSTKAGDTVRWRSGGETHEAEVRAVKHVEPAEGHELGELDLSVLGKLVKAVHALGHNAVNVQLERKSKVGAAHAQWIDAWELCADAELAKQIKAEALVERDKNAIMELLGDPKFSVFYIIEEYGVGAQRWLSEYWTGVPRPIWIKEITEKLFSGFYRSPEGVCGDVRLMAENALSFNEPASQYAKLASELLGALERIKGILASPEEWRVTVRHAWPEIRRAVDLAEGAKRPKPKPEPHTYAEEEDDEPAAKRQRTKGEQPTRRSSRIKKLERKAEAAESRRSRTSYNLR